MGHTLSPILPWQKLVNDQAAKVNHRTGSFVKGFLRSADERETPGGKLTLGLGSFSPNAAISQASSPMVPSLCYLLASDQTSTGNQGRILGRNGVAWPQGPH